MGRHPDADNSVRLVLPVPDNGDYQAELVLDARRSLGEVLELIAIGAGPFGRIDAV